MSNPPISWAQDRSHIFVTLEILNLESQNLEFETREIHFRGKNNSQEYEFQVELLSDIKVETVDWQVKPGGVKITLEKIQRKFWNRLTKHKQNNVKIDWQKWVNEDESEEDIDSDNDNMLQNFNDFKKTLPSELLEKDFSELLPDGNDDITDEEINNSSDDETNVNSTDDGFEANGEDTSLYEENENLRIVEEGNDLNEGDELEVEELDIERLEEDVVKELDVGLENE